MPGPKKNITDHHQHRADLAEDAFSKLEDGAWHLRMVGDDLEEVGFAEMAKEWHKGFEEIQAIIERMRKLPR